MTELEREYTMREDWETDWDNAEIAAIQSEINEERASEITERLDLIRKKMNRISSNITEAKRIAYKHEQEMNKWLDKYDSAISDLAKVLGENKDDVWMKIYLDHCNKDQQEFDAIWSDYFTTLRRDN